MANYSLLVTPTFKPRTFAEMAVPYQMYGEYYNALESSLSTLESALADMEKLKQFEGHEQLYRQYQNFADQLNTYSEKLASGNLKGLRSHIRTAAKDYVKNIKPIEDAYTRAVSAHKVYAEAVAQNPSIMNAPTKNLQDYYDDPLYAWKPMSGDYLKSTLGSLAQQYKSQYNGSTSGGGYTAHHFGLNSTEVNEIMGDDPDAPAKQKYPELVTFINQMKEQYGYNDYTPDKQAMFLDYLKQGLAYGIGQDQVVQNPIYVGSSSSRSGGSPKEPTGDVPEAPEEDEDEDEDADLSFTTVPEVKSNRKLPKAVEKINKAQAKADQAAEGRDVNHEFNEWSDGTRISKQSQYRFSTNREYCLQGWTLEDIQCVVDDFDNIYRLRGNPQKNGGSQFRLKTGKSISWQDMRDMNMTNKKKWLHLKEAFPAVVEAAKREIEKKKYQNNLADKPGSNGPSNMERQLKYVDINAASITLDRLTNSPDPPAQKLTAQAERKRAELFKQYPDYLSDKGKQASVTLGTFMSSFNVVTPAHTMVKAAEKDRVNAWISLMKAGNKSHPSGLDAGEGLYRLTKEGMWEPASPRPLTNPSVSVDMNNGVLIHGYADNKAVTYKIGTNGETSDIDATLKTLNKYLLSASPESYAEQKNDIRLPNGSTLHVEHDKDGHRMFYTVIGDEKQPGYLMDEHGQLYREDGKGGFSNTPRTTINVWIEGYLNSLLQETLTRILTPKKK